MVLGFLTMGATLASSIFSAAFEPLTLEFNIGIQVATLGIALFILAFALGPIIWGPISEWKGRSKSPLFSKDAVLNLLLGLSVLPAYFVFICFTACGFFLIWLEFLPRDFTELRPSPKTFKAS